MMRTLIGITVIVLSATGCADDAATGAADGASKAADAGAEPDTGAGDSAVGGADATPSDALAIADSAGHSPDGTDAGAASDTNADADATLDASPDVSLPGTPTRADVALDWTLQSTPGLGGVLTATTLALRDGGLFVGATFSGEVQIGDAVVSASEKSFTHQLAVRVRPDGTIRFARHLCDGCLGAAATELSDGRIAIAAAATRLVGNPGTPDAIDRSSETPGCTVTIVSADGEVEQLHRFAEGGYTNVRAVVETPDGGLLVGGDAREVVFEDGTVMAVDPGVFYPGQAFVAKLGPDLSTEWVEVVRGTAASSVSMVVPHGDGFAIAGDFGGYPIGVTAELGPEPRVLEAISSDDDPAMDLFVALFEARGELTFARRVQHYGWERPATWIEASDTGVELLLDGVGELKIEQGELYAGYGGDGSALLRFDPDGTFDSALHLPRGAARWPGSSGYTTVYQTSPGFPITLGEGEAALTFETPGVEADTTHASWVLGQWAADGALGRAGQLSASWHAGGSPMTVSASAVQADGSFILYMNGPPGLTLLPDEGESVVLESQGYERMVFVRARLKD